MKLNEEFTKHALVLYGVDGRTPAVDAEVAHETALRAQAALAARGWKVQIILVIDDLPGALTPFACDDWLVLNLCEGSPDQPFYYAHAAAELERRGFAYTGSDSAALHQNQFKPIMKRQLQRAEVPTPRWAAADRVEDITFDSFPAIIKPAAEHCSYGITRDSVVCNQADARRQAALLLQQYPGGVMIEEFIDSEEYGISLWGDSAEVEIMGISVIRYDAFSELKDRLCTYDAKWLPECEAYKKTMPLCPAPLDVARRRELETAARRAHLACGARDYSRADVRLLNGQPMVLDLNLNCAVSPNSGFAETARIHGWEYGVMLERLLEFAAGRKGRREAGRESESTRAESIDAAPGKKALIETQ